jgi:hypothetical protein
MEAKAMKLYTRPRPVEAVQWNKDGDHPELDEHGYCPRINRIVYEGDWIITHEDGRIEVMTEEEKEAAFCFVDELRCIVSRMQ